MEIRKFKNEKYEIVNEAGNTKNGFYHRSTLFVNGFERATNKVDYLNRTWECYRFQTSMLGVIRNIMDDRIEELKEQYKKQNNINRMTAKHKEIFEKIVENDEKMKEYLEIRDEVRGKVW